MASRVASQPVVVPPALRRGSVVRVIAPSSPFDATLFLRGAGWLGERYVVRYGRGIFAARGYLAGDDERRRRELQDAIGEPEVEAVFCARGGYGVSRYAHRVDFAPLRRRPRWLIGFSDVTALHVEAARVGVATLHGPNVTGLGRGDALLREQLVGMLERPTERRELVGRQVIAPGVARGPLYGGNLAMLHACAAAGRLRVPDGCVLLVEDVTERPYRVDRMLATLIASGRLAKVAGVVVGEMTDCDPGPDGVTVEEVLRELCAPLGVPVVSGVPIGHGRNNHAVVLGAEVEVRAGGQGSLVLAPSPLPEDGRAPG